MLRGLKPRRRRRLPELSPGGATAANLTLLSGRLLERGALRYTPAGVEVIEFRVGHVSRQIEAGVSRRVECEMPCVLLGPMANLLTDAKPGDGLKIGGFLAARSLKNPAPVLHVNTMEFLEGNQNGFQTEE